MIPKLLLQLVVWMIIMGAMLFVPAGTLRWGGAWVFLCTFAVLSLAGGLWLAKFDPALLAERMRLAPQRDQPAADKKFMAAFACTLLLWFVLMGLDRRFQSSNMPPVLQGLGFALVLFSTGWIMWVLRENSFAAPVVKVQRERGHHVISTGPYALVRHPMYSGATLYFLGTALLLGSWFGVAISPLFTVLFAIRALIEERTLIAGLEGYADYAARVRYRLLPGIW
jgi:protein-S-isoprenylcysteine O-methyltransferase Ste14